MFLRPLITVIFLSSLLCLTSSQDVNEVDDDVTEREKKQQRLRWFPADTETDCEEEPGAEQVSDMMMIMMCDITLCNVR